MGNPEKKPLRPSMDEGGEYVESRWYPRDGEPVRHRIPRRLLEQARKQRSKSEPFVRFTVVGVRDGEFGFELPDYPGVGMVWMGLAAGQSESGEGRQS